MNLCGSDPPPFPSVDVARRAMFGPSGTLESFISTATFGKYTFDQQHNSIHPNIVTVHGRPTTICGCPASGACHASSCDMSLILADLPNKPIWADQVGTIVLSGSSVCGIGWAMPGDAHNRVGEWVLYNGFVPTGVFHEISHQTFGVDHSAVQVGCTMTYMDTTVQPYKEITVDFALSRGAVDVMDIVPNVDFSCIMSGTLYNSEYFNVAIANVIGITTPIGYLHVGQSGTFTLPNQYTTANNHVQIDFGGGLVYYVAFWGDVSPRNSRDVGNVVPRVHLPGNVVVHKMDPLWSAHVGYPSSVWVKVVLPGKSQTIVDYSGGGQFTVDVGEIRYLMNAEKTISLSSTVTVHTFVRGS